MSTYLELVNLLHRETGVSGPVLTSVVNQTNYNGQLVQWINAAWQEIQMARKWRFMRKVNEFTTVASQQEYTFASISLADFSEIDAHNFIIDTGDGKARVRYLSYEKFLEEFETQTLDENIPQYFTITPDDKIKFFPAPDDVYDVDMHYWKQAVELAANGDEPGIPDQDAMVIVWRALMMYADHNDIPTLRATAKLKYDKVLSVLIRKHLPKFTIYGEPLA